MLPSGVKDSDLNGSKNIPLVKHPLINTNPFPGKAALEERFPLSPHAKLMSINLEIFHLVLRNIKKLHLAKVKNEFISSPM